PERVDDERLLRRPALVHGGLADAGACSHPFDRQPLVSLFAEELDRRLKDRTVRLWVAWTPRPFGRGVHVRLCRRGHASTSSTANNGAPSWRSTWTSIASTSCARFGNHSSATTPPTRVTTVPTASPRSIAWMNEDFAAVTSAIPAAPPTWLPTAIAAPTELWDAVAALAGRPVSQGPSVAVYADANTLPRIATPRAPPICRVVVFIADPTPALASGSEPMIDSVAGVIASAMPVPRTMIEINTWPYPDAIVRVDRYQSPAATVPIPSATRTLFPSWFTSRPVIGETTINTTAIGATRYPAWRAE